MLKSSGSILIKTKPLSFLLSLFAIAHLLPCALTGQSASPAPAANGNPAQTLPAASKQVPINSEVILNYSFSPEAGLKHGTQGDVEISSYVLDYRLMIPLSEDIILFTGLFGSFVDLDLNGTSVLPDSLKAAGLSVGLSKKINSQWSALLMLRPYVSSDSSGFSGSGFNIPALFSLEFTQSEKLKWTVGIIANPQGDHVVLPAAGIHWNFAPSWTLSVGIPRTEIKYDVSSSLTLKGRVQFHGGTYYISKAHASGLGDTWLNYSDIRVGIGLEYRFSKNFSIEADVGAVVDREFDYFDRDYSVDGKTTEYFGISLRARF